MTAKCFSLFLEHNHHFLKCILIWQLKQQFINKMYDIDSDNKKIMKEKYLTENIVKFHSFQNLHFPP